MFYVEDREYLKVIPDGLVGYIKKLLDKHMAPQKRADKISKYLVKYDDKFKEKHTGTNVLTMKHSDYPDVVYKVGLTPLGLIDNIKDEWLSQLLPFYVDLYYLKPGGYYSVQAKMKTFENTIEASQYTQEMIYIYESLINDYDMLLVDMSLKTIYNVGIDTKSGLLKLIDGSDMIQLNGYKLRCDNIKFSSVKIGNKNKDPYIKAHKAKSCDGKLFYDENYEFLVCDKCNKKYLPIDIARKIEHEEGYRKMNMSLGLNNLNDKHGVNVLLSQLPSRFNNLVDDTLDLDLFTEIEEEDISSDVSDESNEISDECENLLDVSNEWAKCKHFMEFGLTDEKYKPDNDDDDYGDEGLYEDDDIDEGDDEEDDSDSIDISVENHHISNINNKLGLRLVDDPSAKYLMTKPKGFQIYRDGDICLYYDQINNSFLYFDRSGNIDNPEMLIASIINNILKTELIHVDEYSDTLDIMNYSVIKTI